MRKGIGTHDRLVRLHMHSRHRRNQPAGPRDLGRNDSGAIGQHIVAHLQRHRDFLYRCIAGPLADPVDGRFHLPRAGRNGSQRVGDGKAQVIVAVGREHREVGIGHPRDHVREHRAIGLRRPVTHRVGQVDRPRTGLDRRLDCTRQEIRLRSGGILGGPFHIVTRLRASDTDSRIAPALLRGTCSASPSCATAMSR
jgi:hypothetical protein